MLLFLTVDTSTPVALTAFQLALLTLAAISALAAAAWGDHSDGPGVLFLVKKRLEGYRR